MCSKFLSLLRTGTFYAVFNVCLAVCTWDYLITLIIITKDVYNWSYLITYCRVRDPRGGSWYKYEIRPWNNDRTTFLWMFTELFVFHVALH